MDYAKQTSWLLFLKYLDGLEQDKSMEAELEGKAYTFILKGADKLFDVVKERPVCGQLSITVDWQSSRPKKSKQKARPNRFGRISHWLAHHADDVVRPRNSRSFSRGAFFGYRDRGFKRLRKKKDCRRLTISETQCNW